MTRVTDPHPSDEEHPYRERNPGGAATPVDDNLDDKGRDVNSGKIDDKRHPQGDLDRGAEDDDRR